MNANCEPATPALINSSPEPFSEYIGRFKAEMYKQFRQENDIDQLSLSRGFGAGVLEAILACKPFAVAIPEAQGGRGVRIDENLAVLSAAAYESLALSLTIGINNGLFLQPLGKYCGKEVAEPVFRSFMERNHMGGLMITEPGHGSDALNMRTRFFREEGQFRLQGMKHWAGLTGLADYWLLTAREARPGKPMSRDVSFFLYDRNANPDGLVVEEYFENLGLYPIPYGRNRIDLLVPESHRLVSGSSGIQLMLDLLHRSRLQFPGMALGFIQRMLDESISYCQERFVGGKSLLAFDQVQEKLGRMQAWFTLSSAACLYSSRNAGIENDLAGFDLQANAVKSSISDFMHESAQLLVQLTGARAYRLDHVGGRGIVDSRPFQIFEGSNDILYIQLGESILKGMKRIREPNLFKFFSQADLAPRAASYFQSLLNFSPEFLKPQRKKMELGKIISRVFVAEMVFDLFDTVFRSDLIDNALKNVWSELVRLVAGLNDASDIGLIADYKENSQWLTGKA